MVAGGLEAGHRELAAVVAPLRAGAHLGHAARHAARARGRRAPVDFEVERDVGAGRARELERGRVLAHDARAQARSRRTRSRAPAGSCAPTLEVRERPGRRRIRERAHRSHAQRERGSVAGFVDEALVHERARSCVVSMRAVIGSEYSSTAGSRGEWRFSSAPSMR